jgi:hypothetical protein
MILNRIEKVRTVTSHINDYWGEEFDVRPLGAIFYPSAPSSRNSHRETILIEVVWGSVGHVK